MASKVPMALLLLAALVAAASAATAIEHNNKASGDAVGKVGTSGSISKDTPVSDAGSGDRKLHSLDTARASAASKPNPNTKNPGRDLLSIPSVINTNGPASKPNTVNAAKKLDVIIIGDKTNKDRRLMSSYSVKKTTAVNIAGDSAPGKTAAVFPSKDVEGVGVVVGGSTAGHTK